MKLLQTLILILFSLPLFAQSNQIQIFPEDGDEFSSKFIIESLILEGVNVLNLETNFDQEDICMGYFIDPSRQFGIEQGMILSTGSVGQITRLNSESNYTSLGIDSSTLLKFTQLGLIDSIKFYQDLLEKEKIKSASKNDFDLSNEIEGLETFDARVIEIEFIPTADTFYYRYVFASEEYDEYVCSQFNDIFAFYIYQQEGTKINTALVPNKSIPVSINNINNGNPKFPTCPKSNPYLYQKNDGSQKLLFDGFTKVLDIRFKVNPGEKYFIKIAIADASDHVLDSAVLIENSSIFSYFESYEMFFQKESYEIQGVQRLKKIINSLNKYPNSKIQLIGHSDITGPESYNLELSINRVNAIKDYLTKNGISESRMILKYKGELMPRYDKHNLNRRVEIFILGE